MDSSGRAIGMGPVLNDFAKSEGAYHNVKSPTHFAKSFVLKKNP